MNFQTEPHHLRRFTSCAKVPTPSHFHPLQRLYRESAKCLRIAVLWDDFRESFSGPQTIVPEPRLTRFVGVRLASGREEKLAKRTYHQRTTKECANKCELSYLVLNSRDAGTALTALSGVRSSHLSYRPNLLAGDALTHAPSGVRIGLRVR